MLRIAAFALALCIATDLHAQSTMMRGHAPHSSMPTMHPAGIQLRPGETLTAINGVPVQNRNLSHTNSSQASYRAASSQRSIPAQQSPQAGRNGLIVNRDSNAYAHAVREAGILASRGENYHRHGDGGHPLGVAPGCGFSGTGYSRDPNRPNHCYLGELPDSRLVARAMVPGPNGTYYWSAHYR